MPGKPSDIETTARKLYSEGVRDAEVVAAGLWPSRPPGMEKLTIADYVDLFRRNYSQPAGTDLSPEWFHAQIGERNFRVLYKDAYGVSIDDVLKMAPPEPPQVEPTPGVGMPPPAPPAGMMEG